MSFRSTESPRKDWGTEKRGFSGTSWVMRALEAARLWRLEANGEL
jgi:hypothetical protein